MPTHPYWAPYEQVTPQQLAAAFVTGAPTPVPDRRIDVVAPDPEWPAQYELLESIVRDALGDRALSITHVGSTSVPGLWAKPVIDIDLLVADSADESAYLPDLEAAGFVLTVREPDWHEHRCFRHAVQRCNLHVFGPDAIEPERHRAFRDWLRTHPDDREVYQAVKRRLAEQPFDSVMDYNNAKSAVIYEIYERIFAADPDHEHTPHPIP